MKLDIHHRKYHKDYSASITLHDNIVWEGVYPSREIAASAMWEASLFVVGVAETTKRMARMVGIII